MEQQWEKDNRVGPYFDEQEEHDHTAADREHIARMAQAELLGWRDEVATLSSVGFYRLSDEGMTETEREALAQAARRATTWRFDVLAG